MIEDISPEMVSERVVENGDEEVCLRTSADDECDQKELGEVTTKEGIRSVNDAPSQQDRSEEADPIRLLDKELMELDELIGLQQRKVAALETLRKQFLSGERSRPDVRLGFLLEDTLSSPGSTMQPSEEVALIKGIDRLLGKKSNTVAQITPLTEYPSPRNSRLDRGFRGPPADESFEKYMGSYGTIPRSDAQLVAVEILTFRLRGATGRRNRAQKTQSKRQAPKQTGHVTLVASLYANGVVYLHEPTGEELLVYDTGHGRPGCSSGAAPGESPSASKPPAAAPELGDPVVSALSADASDVDPLLLTTGTDGTVRVHALTVLINGRRVAGRVHPSRRKQSKSKPDGDGTKKSNKSKKGSGDEKQGVVESSRDEEGKEDGVPGEVSGEHAQGMEVKAQFRLCLGSACPSTPAGGCEVDLGPGQAVADVELERRLTSADSPEKAITSTTAFFHRGMDTAVVVAGYATGGIGFIHAVNGTELGSVGGTSAVRAIVRGGQYIAYTDGQDVRFASTTKLESIPDRVCRGGWAVTNGQSGRPGAPVTALAFDAVATSLLYVGYGSGEVMVFNNRVQEVDGSFRCLPGYDLPHPRGAGVDDDGVGCNALSTVRGYLLVSRGPVLAVYNTTDDMKLLFVSSGIDLPPAASAAIGGTAEGNNSCPRSSIPGRWAALPSFHHGDPLLVEAAACAPGLAVYKAYLPFERSTSDMSWVRGPIVLLGILVVAITKVYTGRRDGNSTSRGSRGRGRGGRRGARDDDDDDDLDLSSNDRDLTSLRERVYQQRAAERSVGSRRGDRETRRRGAQRFDDPWNRDNDDSG